MQTFQTDSKLHLRKDNVNHVALVTNLYHRWRQSVNGKNQTVEFFMLSEPQVHVGY